MGVVPVSTIRKGSTVPLTSASVTIGASVMVGASDVVCGPTLVADTSDEG